MDEHLRDRLTVRRVLAQISPDKPRHHHSTNALQREVPARRIAWDIGEVGHFEVDLVHHCGASSAGEYVYTLQMVGVTSGWVELWAVLGRSYRVMEDAFMHLLARVPVAVRELHPDNGTEFFNAHLLRFWQRVLPGVVLSRSRAYHKNDNRFVEERNRTVVRSWVEDGRLDTVAQTVLLNRIYEKLWCYHNLFLPVLRLASKEPVLVEGRWRVRRVYERACTPLERLEALKRLQDGLNRFWNPSPVLSPTRGEAFARRR